MLLTDHITLQKNNNNIIAFQNKHMSLWKYSNVPFLKKRSKYCHVTMELITDSPCEYCVFHASVKAIVSAPTVHSHGRSQRVSLRGVNRTLPFCCRMDEMCGV